MHLRNCKPFYLHIYFRIIQDWIVAYHLSLTNLKWNFDQTKIKQNERKCPIQNRKMTDKWKQTHQKTGKFYIEGRDIHIKCHKQFKLSYTFKCLGRAGRFGQC